jgi:hypothetical protein
MKRTSPTKITVDAGKIGFQHLSDRDARDPAGLHPGAHLWMGKDAVSGFKRCIKSA